MRQRERHRAHRIRLASRHHAGNETASFFALHKLQRALCGFAKSIASRSQDSVRAISFCPYLLKLDQRGPQEGSASR